jgi:hypothetical protein
MIVLRVQLALVISPAAVRAAVTELKIPDGFVEVFAIEVFFPDQFRLAESKIRKE